MQVFDEKYIIRQANIYDIDSIMIFIDNYWKNGHILSRDKHLFEYEFVFRDKVNMILAIERSKNSIEGIFGFIYCSNPLTSKKLDIWGSLWYVKDGNVPFLGVELAKKAYEITKCRMHIGSGANVNTTIPIRKMIFKDKVGKMKHYYYLNNMINDYKICVVNEKCCGSKIVCNYDSLISYSHINSFNEFRSCFSMKANNDIPYKDDWYINRRYFTYPYYKYIKYAIKYKDEVKAIIIMREVSAKNSKAIRIIDVLGDVSYFQFTHHFFEKLMIENNYEYVDFLCFGVPDELIKNAGFCECNDNTSIIIPNYFEPFVQKNIDIWVHYKFDGTRFFKGDCDQDRPNIVRL